MSFVNLTPHNVTVVVSGDAPAAHTYPASGTVARVRQIDTPVRTLEGVPVFASEFGPVEGLPDPAPGTYYIVSVMVMQACRGRTDLVHPVGLVRDANGNVVGCRGFSFDC